MIPDSLLRRAEHKALAAITIQGKVLDLGGDRRSGSRDFIQSDGATFTIVNMSPETKPDILHDLEKPLPIESGSYDGVLLINVLEHIFNCQQLLTESIRVLKPGGTIVVVVPFLFPVHPSPSDYWRFTGESLTRLLKDAGCVDVILEPLGTGVFASRFVMLDRLMPYPLRVVGQIVGQPITSLLDTMCTFVAKVLNKSYVPSDYALGYCVRASATR